MRARTKNANPDQTWTVAEAKARLSEILRLADEVGPQRIGVRKAFIVVPADSWHAKTSHRKPLGQWLVRNLPRGIELDTSARRSNRKIPFLGEEDE